MKEKVNNFEDVEFKNDEFKKTKILFKRGGRDFK